MRMILALLFWLAALPSAAQTQPLVSPIPPGVTPDERQAFQQCRAAIFFHLAPRARHMIVPPAVAQAMLEQMSFVMSMTLRNSPGESLAAERETLNFVENFFLSFSGILSQERDLATDVDKREAG